MARVRRRVVEQVIKGKGAAEVAEVIGVSKQAVYSWVRAFNEGGFAALEAKKAPGKAPKLTVGQVAKLRTIILGADPRQLRFEFALWTREMIAELIEGEFEVTMSVSAVGRLLRSVGLSPQRPIWRAYQADPDAVEAWRTEVFPGIRADAAKVGGVVLFQDEAAVRADFHAGTTWGEVGHTPVVKTTGARYSVNMMSAVSPRGDLHFMLTEGTVDSDVFISFCERLVHDNPGRPVFLIVDGHSSHKSKKTKAWVASTKGRIRLFYLPGYSPQLNPDEWVWKNVKADRIGKAGVTSFEDLRNKAVAALRRLADYPEIIRGFFRDPNLQYILPCK